MKKFLVGLLASIGGLVIFALLALIIIAKITQSQHQTIQPNTVLTIDFKGAMAENSQEAGLSSYFGNKQDSLYHLVQTIDQASKDPRVKGIVARIDQASMGLAQAQELRNAIMRFRVAGRDSNKFTIAHADTFGEVGQGTVPYYLATAFDEIWLQPEGDVCLTGLYVEAPFAKELLEHIGIKAQMGMREEYKSAVEGLIESHMTKPNREELQTLLTSLMNQVVRDTAMGRELNEVDVWDAVNKGPLFGPEALKLGFIDRQDYYDEIKAYAETKLPGGAKFMKAHNYLESNPLPEPEKGKSKIALIYGTGAITRDSSNYPGLLDSKVMGGIEISRAFEKATQDEDVAAIVFRVDSPGGSHIASETILHAARKAQQAGKPVIVSMSDVAASGGYWISTFADKIVAHPSTITGSIGVVSGKLVTKDAWASIGVNWDGVKSGENADMWSSSESFSPYGWERLQGALDNVYKAFIDRVAEGRKLPKEHVLQIAKGRVWSGEDALKFGLVDKLGDLKEALELAKEAASLKDQVIPVEIFPKPKSFTETLQTLLLHDDDANTSDLGVLAPAIRALGFINNIYMQVCEHANVSGDMTVTSIKKIK